MKRSNPVAMFLGHADSISNAGVKVETIVYGDVEDLPEAAHQCALQQHQRRTEGELSSSPGPEMIEVLPAGSFRNICNS